MTLRCMGLYCVTMTTSLDSRNSIKIMSIMHGFLAIAAIHRMRSERCSRRNTIKTRRSASGKICGQCSKTANSISMTCAAVLWSRSSRTNVCGTASWSRLTKSWQEDHRLLRAKRSAATSRVPAAVGKSTRNAVDTRVYIQF